MVALLLEEVSAGELEVALAPAELVVQEVTPAAGLEVRLSAGAVETHYLAAYLELAQ